MAENYSLNSKFGLNVSKQSIQNPKINEEVISSSGVGKLFDTMTNYVAKYENVLNGDVEEKINMYSRQAMFLGMNLKSQEGKKRFDVNI